METKLQKMDRKSMVFTVEDESSDKPIVWAELTDGRALNDQEFAETLVRAWAEKYLAACEYRELFKRIQDIAYDMRKNGFAWFNENWCFELSELKSSGSV